MLSHIFFKNNFLKTFCFSSYKHFSTNAAKKSLVWLDCDPGHDDAMAILLAGYHPTLKLLGISSVFGNQSIEKTTKNVLKMLCVSGLTHITAYKGAAEPLLRKPQFAEKIHGESGLDGADFPEPTNFKLLTTKCIQHMYEVISQQNEKVNLVATGALTNVALLLKSFSDIKSHLNQIVLMGGGINEGNWTPRAEFNIFIDPEAADIVFNSGVKIVAVPLEVTHTALCTPDIFAKIAKINTNFSKIIYGILLQFAKNYESVFRFSKGPPIHDPCAIAYVIDQTKFQGQLMEVQVERNSKFCDGALVCNHHVGYDPEQKWNKNIFMTQKIDVDWFWQIMLDAVMAANKISPINQ